MGPDDHRSAEDRIERVVRLGEILAGLGLLAIIAGCVALIIHFL